MDASEPFLSRALRLAARGRYRTSPNPMVGALVVRGGEVVGSGWHRRLGGPHAEAEALAAAGERARGATLYVTLEPCNHHGRTPPCSDAVLAAGIRRVVACHRDPNPGVRGGGFERLRAAGVEVSSGHLLEPAVELNWRFLVTATERRPAVTVKWAMSLDGRIASASGESQWISSPAGRRWGLDQRECHDAILVGSTTALTDDPRLDRRLGRAEGPNVRVVLDRRLRLPAAARMFEIPGQVLIYTESTDREACRRLERRGAAVIRLPAVDPPSVLADLYRREVKSLLVEGGATVAAAFVAAGLYDRVAVDCAPLLLAGEAARGPLGGAGFKLAAAPRLSKLRAARRGPDLILSGFRERCLPDLYASVAD
jgi:diaminohydroxyphosphoribosylaminopyrimidine deaminase / 5-amino-6-(5-phosphoribosylamino)uracil reductase